MNTKKIIGTVLTILGAIALIAGVFGIFQGNLLGLNPWASTIIGIVFFLSGIGLMKTVDASAQSSSQ